MKQSSNFDFTEMREKMIREHLIFRGISEPVLIEAFRKVPRHEFVADSQKQFAYDDCALPYRLRQTVSQPYIVAVMTMTVLHGRRRRNVLEIGTGSGYQTAILAELFERVYTIEYLKELSQSAQKKLASFGYKHIHYMDGDGHKGWVEHAPFDAIVVTCAPGQIPVMLKDQLNREDGRMVIPVGGSSVQKLMKVSYSNGTDELQYLDDVCFVPMLKSK